MNFYQSATLTALLSRQCILLKDKWLPYKTDSLVAKIIDRVVSEWVTDWPIHCLIDWSTDNPLNWLVERLNDWLSSITKRFLVSLLHWLTDQLTDWQTSRSNYKMDCPIGRFLDSLNHWLSEWLKEWLTDRLAGWVSDSLLLVIIHSSLTHSLTTSLTDCSSYLLYYWPTDQD